MKSCIILCFTWWGNLIAVTEVSCCFIIISHLHHLFYTQCHFLHKNTAWSSNNDKCLYENIRFCEISIHLVNNVPVHFFPVCKVVFFHLGFWRSVVPRSSLYAASISHLFSVNTYYNEYRKVSKFFSEVFHIISKYDKIILILLF